MPKHEKPEDGKPLGNVEPKKRGRGGDEPIGQPSDPKPGKHRPK